LYYFLLSIAFVLGEPGQSPCAKGPSFALRIMVLGASLACLRLAFRHTERASSPRTTHTLHDKKRQVWPMLSAKTCTKNKLFAHWQYLDLGMLHA